MASTRLGARPTGRLSPATGAALAVLAIALGLLSADGWRWPVGPLADIASAQGVWALGAWLTGRLLARDGRQAAVLGALFPVVGLAAYYVYEWLAYDAQAATSQLGASGGYWLVLGAAGGAGFGVLGRLASRPGRWAAYAVAIPAVVLVAEAVFLVLARGRFYGSLLVVVVALVALAGLVLADGVRRFGARALLPAVLVCLVVAPVLGLAFLWLETHLGYLTI